MRSTCTTALGTSAVGVLLVGGGSTCGYIDQDVYLKALIASASVDHIELGYYVSRVK
jgi:hypothetical protein